MTHTKKHIVISLTTILLLIMISAAFLIGCKPKESVIGISVGGKPQTVYALDEALNLNDGYLELRLLKGLNQDFKQIPLSKATVTGFDSGTVGKKTMVFTYGEHKAELPYEVRDAANITTHARIYTVLSEEGLEIRLRNLDIALIGAEFSVKIPSGTMSYSYTPHPNLQVESATRDGDTDRIVLRGQVPVSGTECLLLTLSGFLTDTNVTSPVLTDYRNVRHSAPSYFA